MSTIAEQKRCLKCGQPLGGLAPEGICARCLLLTGFDQPAEEGTKHHGEPEQFAADLPRRFGEYELLEEIARGGMGIVYKARQISLDRIVAIKMLLFGRYATEEFIHRFRVEASAAASLQHPNIVAIHEVGVHQGQHYFAMDFVDGPNLAEFIGDQPLPPKRAAAYVKTAAEAIHFAHQRRILHRDLKPSNILIDSNDQPRITDFGLAKRLDDSASGALQFQLTLTGQTLGSPNYIPPEQASVQRGKIGPHSDVYSLGAVLYHALTARPPFVGQTLADTLQQVLNHEPVAPHLLNPQVPVDLESICLKCLERESARRYSNAQELADDLGRFLNDEPTCARPVTRGERAWRWCRHNPPLAVSVGLVLALLLILGIGSPIAALSIRRAQREAEENLYVANIHQATEAINGHDLARSRELLAAIEKSPQQRAMRGWEWRFLVERTRSDEVAILGRHDSWLSDLAVSPDRHLAATISQDGVVKLWDLNTERQVASWSAHANLFSYEPDWAHHAVVFTPDGSSLITAGEDGAVHFWKIGVKPQLIQTITNLPHPVNRLAISPDGKTLAGQARGYRVYAWQLTTPQPSQTADFHCDCVVPYGLSFSPDGKTLLVGWVDKPLARYDFSDRDHPRELTPLIGAKPMFVFSPHGDWLASCGASGHIVRRWTWPEMVPFPPLQVIGGHPDAFAISPDQQLLVAGSYGGQINVWNLTSREPNQIPTILHGHEDAMANLAFGLSGDRVKLISTSADKSVRLWDPAQAKNKEVILRLDTPVLAVAISSNGLYLATVKRMPIPPGADRSLKMFTFQLWDFDSRLEKGSFSFGNGEGTTPTIAFSPDSRQVGVSDFETLRFYEVPSLNPLKPEGSRGLVYAADNGCLAYVRDNTNIVKRASLTAPEFILASGDLRQLALSPNGKILVNSCGSGEIQFRDARDGHLLRSPLTNHTLSVVTIAFTPDGKTLITAGWDGHLGIWDVEHWRNRAFPRGHNNQFNWATISPDGGMIASGGEDSFVRLWNVARAQEIAVLQGHTDSINCLSFSPDGQWLASASDDGTVRFWKAPLPSKARETRMGTKGD